MTLNFLLEDKESEVNYIPEVDQVPLFTKNPTTPEEEFDARVNTAKFQLFSDPEPIPEEEARHQARVGQSIFQDYRMPAGHEKEMPVALLQIDRMLKEYDKELVHDAVRIKNYVTNKLLAETVDADPRIRLKAYELLGKITEVALFTERTEATVRHKTSEELEGLIREKLNRIIDVTPEKD